MSMKRIILLLLASFFIFQITLGQSVIRGSVVIESSREPVDAATVTLHPKGSTKIFAHTLTGQDGTFALQIRHALPDTVTINVRSMNIKTHSKTIVSSISYVEFLVKEEIRELKEVIVKMPKVKQLGDTISYHVGSFIDGTDRSIGDVLKKLPGVQVLSSGEILYQNKPISQFYIEGMDLLQGKYGIATKNIDAKDVASVEVLENHQHIKALKGMALPDVAAINLKLKQSSLGAFFLNAQIGAGVSPLLLSNELVGMRFTRKQQNMLVYKGDNSGRDIAQELVSFYDFMNNMPEQFMSVVSAVAPAISNQHYLFNDAHLGSFNDLRTMGKDYTLTTNINYLNDKQRKSSYSEREIYIKEGENIQIVEDMSSKYHKQELDGTMTIEGNKEDYYLNNKLKLIARWNNEVGDVRSGDFISQRLDMPSLNLSNSFEYLIKKNRKQRYNIKSDIIYAQQNHQLSVTPSIFPLLSGDAQAINTLVQSVQYRKFSTDTTLRTGTEWDRGFVWVGASIFTNHYAINSAFQDDPHTTSLTVDAFRNELTRGEIGVSFSPRIGLEITRKLKPELTLPVTYLWVSKEDKIRQNGGKRGYWLFSPSLYLNYPITNRMDMVARMGYGNQIGGIRDDLMGYIMTSYRNLSRNDGEESRSSNAYTSLRLDYKNPFTTLFLSGELFLRSIWRNRLYDAQYNGIVSSITSIVHPYVSPSYGVSLSLSKSIDIIRSEIHIGARYDKSKSIVLNQGVISPFDLENIGGYGSISTKIKRFMVIRYNTSYTLSNANVGGMKQEPMHYFTQSLRASIMPTTALVLSTELNHYYKSTREHSERSSWFGNLGVKYKFKNVDLMLDWTNIFNTKQFITQTYDDAGRYYTQYQIRPSEIMLRLRFKLL